MFGFLEINWKWDVVRLILFVATGASPVRIDEINPDETACATVRAFWLRSGIPLPSAFFLGTGAYIFILILLRTDYLNKISYLN